MISQSSWERRKCKYCVFSAKAETHFNLAQNYSSISLSISRFLNRGEVKPIVATTPIVIIPPKTTAGTTPIIFDVKPLSKAPSSFDEPTNIEFTDDTLPRMLSGV